MINQEVWAVVFKGDEDEPEGICYKDNNVLIFYERDDEFNTPKEQAENALEQFFETWVDLNHAKYEVRRIMLREE